ncbi:VWA domain-containing protein [Desulfovibrio sp. OttesenSCG-928-C14]|nr:VWA domain-containing protein [Desulfovibrio sp. OttesenSCG-928-C14]
MQNKHVISSLPLLASVLGRKYGVKVHIGGSNACTDGRTIYLPSLAAESDENTLGLVRGFIDHESAHLRATDFEVLRIANLTPLEKHIWNILEDYAVEHKLADVFPGCRKNFDWLIRKMFLNSEGAQAQPIRDPGLRVIEWLLLTVRSWDVPELQPEIAALAVKIESAMPGLLEKLLSSLSTVRQNSASTWDRIQKAQELVKILQRYLHLALSDAEQGRASTGQSGGKGSAGFDSRRARALQSLDHLLTGNTALPQDFGSEISHSLRLLHQQSGEDTCVAIPASKHTWPLGREVLLSCRQATTALRTRLQALLQSLRQTRNRYGYAGKLDANHLHKVPSGDARIFRKNGEKQALNTAVHILLDSSGSMSGEAMELAAQACFALASALHPIPGISVAVTAFPGKILTDLGNGEHCRHTVVPLLRHKQKLHQQFGITALGGTPMDSALWWVLQDLHFQPEKRKIILVITDGEPDDLENTRKAIKSAMNLNVEVYGIGILEESIATLLPEQRARIIKSINELPAAMFTLLQKALTH